MDLYGTGVSDNNERPEFYEALGRALKAERAARGLSRQELADLAGISYPYLSEIENGSKRASSKALFMLADALGMAPSELMGSAERMPSRDRDRTSTRSPNRAQVVAERMMMAEYGRPDRDALVGEIMRAVQSMSDEDLELVARLARKLAR